MEVFVGNLPSQATEYDLITFFKGFSKKATIKIVLKKGEDGQRYRYGHVTFETDKLALKAIKKFHGKELHGATLEIREYFHRSYSNERRAVGWRNKPWSGVERRKEERRQREAVAEKDDFEKILERVEKEPEEDEIRIEGYRDMARKF